MTVPLNLSSLQGPIDCSDRAVFDRVYRKYGPAAASKLKHLTGMESVANELVQEVFIKLWKKGHTFDHEAALFTWLYRTSHNTGIDFLRSAAHRRESVAYDAQSDVRIATEDQTDVFVTRDVARLICSRISERDAQIVTYLAFDGMTHDEVARMMDISKKTVTRAVLNARSVLSAEEIRSGFK